MKRFSLIALSAALAFSGIAGSIEGPAPAAAESAPAASAPSFPGPAEIDALKGFGFYHADKKIYL